MSSTKNAFIIERKSTYNEGQEEAYFPVRVFLDREKALVFQKGLNDFVKNNKSGVYFNDLINHYDKDGSLLGSLKIPEDYKDCIDDLSDIFVLTGVRIVQ